MVPTVGGERELNMSNRYTVTTRMVYFRIKVGSDVSHLNIPLIVKGKVTRQCP